MPFHRTPAEMADDVSYARSGCGESRSRHLLWLTPDDLVAVGEEPPKNHGRIDFDDPVAVARERREAAAWKEWWGRVSRAVDVRRSEALRDRTWSAEYERLLRLRRDAGPAEMAELQAGWEAFDREHPMRGLTDAEKAEASDNWTERMRLAREYRAVERKDRNDPRLASILADMKARDRRNDELYDLSKTRPSWNPEDDVPTVRTATAATDDAPERRLAA